MLAQRSAYLTACPAASQGARGGAASDTLADMGEKHDHKERGVYRLSEEDEREALEQCAEDVRADRLATDEEVDALFDEYCQSLD